MLLPASSCVRQVSQLPSSCGATPFGSTCAVLRWAYQRTHCHLFCGRSDTGGRRSSGDLLCGSGTAVGAWEVVVSECGLRCSPRPEGGVERWSALEPDVQRWVCVCVCSAHNQTEPIRVCMMHFSFSFSQGQVELLRNIALPYPPRLSRVVVREVGFTDQCWWDCCQELLRWAKIAYTTGQQDMACLMGSEADKTCNANW